MKTKSIVLAGIIMAAAFVGVAAGGIAVWWLAAPHHKGADYSHSSRQQKEAAANQAIAREQLSASIQPKAAEQNEQWQLNQQNSPKKMQTIPNQNPQAFAPRHSIPSRSVFVNGQRLTDQQLQALEQGSLNRIADGRYWYDRLNGGWGAEGGPCAGVIVAGLNLGGPLRADASAGNTAVFINGRELHAMDVATLQRFLRVQQGRYWVDAQGNFGYEGGYALGNLFQLARAATGGAGGGRDNFWSGRFAAGNHDPESGAGYVSVPGYGPVGYGPY